MDPSTTESPTCSHSCLPLTVPLHLPTDTIPKKRSKFHPSFTRVLEHFLTPLCPLISVTTNLPHADFPATLLAFHLLTSAQLDSLARHYHQVWPPAPETTRYPKPIPAWVGAPSEHDVDLDTKRRRFGRFIGLRGCDSPTQTVSVPAWESWTRELMLRIERECEEALVRARQEDWEGMLPLPKGGGGY